MDRMNSELMPGEYHPAADSALAWVKSRTVNDLYTWLAVFSSDAIEGSSSALIYGETLKRLLDGKPVSDRYLLGLAWVLKELSERR